MATYKNRSGLDKPFDTAVYEGLLTLLDPLLKAEGPNVATDVGPVFQEVKPLTWDLYSLSQPSSSVDRKALANLIPKTAPALAIHIFGFKDLIYKGRSTQDIQYELPVWIYFCAKSPGLIYQSRSTKVTTHDPGLTVLKELLMDHLFGAIVVLGPDLSLTLKSIDMVEMLGPIGNQWWAVMKTTLRANYTQCASEEFDSIVGMRIPYEVPKESGAPLTVQGEDFP